MEVPKTTVTWTAGKKEALTATTAVEIAKPNVNIPNN
jgi:hypothetical protein